VARACRACTGCVELPDDDQQAPDTAPQDSAEPEDTGPPAPCAFPEEEPNNTLGQAQEIDIEAWACGTISESGDLDTFRFVGTEEGWLRVWVRGFDIGSYAELSLYVSDNTQEYAAIQLNSEDSTDPLLVVPVPDGHTWFAQVGDAYGGAGERYIWELIGSITKAPVEWTVEEVEPNDIMVDGQFVEDGDVIYGTVGVAGDYDWFLFEVPEGKVDIVARVVAKKEGSPLDATLVLYTPDGVVKSTVASGELGSDRDPLMEISLDEAGTWGLLMKSVNGANPLFWYSLEFSMDTEADTGQN